MEVIFLGTGTSSSLPNIDCLTAPPDKEPCHTCLSTLRPEGKKNIRRNTSVVLRIDGKDRKTLWVISLWTCIHILLWWIIFSTIVIDVGKNFLAAALEWFPKYGLRHIDAVLITHAHADGMSSGSIAQSLLRHVFFNWQLWTGWMTCEVMHLPRDNLSTFSGLSVKLWGWTLRGAIQSHIDLYVSQTTLGEVVRSFPYLVSKEFASGGGDV